MPDAYLTREELSGEIPLTDIEAALTDGGGDSEDVWVALSQSVADEIHGLLAPAYAWPFPEPFHPMLKTAARPLTLYRLYLRRGLAGDANPMKDEAAAARKRLSDIGTRKVLLDVNSPAPASPPASRAPKAVTGPGAVASHTPGRMPI